MRFVVPEAYASTLPLWFPTIAMFDVTAPSDAFSVETDGMGSPSAQSVRYPSEPTGTTVALKTYCSAAPGTLQVLPATFTGGLRCPLKAPPDERVSMTRHGEAAYNDSPPASGAA